MTPLCVEIVQINGLNRLKNMCGTVPISCLFISYICLSVHVFFSSFFVSFAPLFQRCRELEGGTGSSNFPTNSCKFPTKEICMLTIPILSLIRPNGGFPALTFVCLNAFFFYKRIFRQVKTLGGGTSPCPSFHDITVLFYPYAIVYAFCM